MKIDINDIKFWMDAIRSSDDRDRTLETFWGGQIKSKLWLIEQLEKHKAIRNAECIIHGGWNGLLACMIFNSELGIKHITSIDIDPKCKEIASTMNCKGKALSHNGHDAMQHLNLKHIFSEWIQKHFILVPLYCLMSIFNEGPLWK